MPKVHFTAALKRFYPDLTPLSIEGQTVAEVIKQLDTIYPGITDYLLDEQGSLRQHINIFINDTMINDRYSLTDTTRPDNDILIFQALSGG